jgi:hypothetical protein
LIEYGWTMTGTNEATGLQRIAGDDDEGSRDDGMIVWIDLGVHLEYVGTASWIYDTLFLDMCRRVNEIEQ